MRHSATQIRHVVRRLRRAPAFTAVTVLTLAIGIGANTAIFSVIDGVLLKPLPFSESDRLVGVWHKAPGVNIPLLNASPSTYLTYKKESRTFENLALWNQSGGTVTGRGEPERVEELTVTYEFFSVLRAKPALGRFFVAKDDAPGAVETAVLSYGYWQRRFGGDPGAVGRRIVVDGKSRDIIGVAPRDFKFLYTDPQLFVPEPLDRANVSFGHFSYKGIARLNPGATLEQANADVARMIPMTLDRFPMPPGFTRKMFEATKMGPNIRPLKMDLLGDVGRVLWILMGTVGIVLLIACANVANLFLVRADGRQQELAVRAALGAGWGRLARELLAESVGLGLAGGVLGVGFAYAALRLLVYLAPSNLPRLDEIGIDSTVLLFTLAVSLVAGVLFGLIPVFKYAGANLGAALKEGGRVLGESRSRGRARSVLVVSQMALALVLLVSSGLMIRTFQALRHVAPGFVMPAEVLTFRVQVPDGQPESADAVARIHQQIIEKVAQLPGVVSASAANAITMDGNNSNDAIFVEERPMPEGQIPPIRRYKYLTPRFFETMGNPILAGRNVTWDDIYQKRMIVLVSENLAREYWKTPSEAIGKRVRNSPKGPWREIVGVVGNERDDGVSRKAPAIVYWPMIVNQMWNPGVTVQRRMAYAVRSPRANTAAFLNEVRQAVRSVDAALPITNVQTLQKVYERSLAPASFTLVMLGIASGMALLLGLVGIYGVISYSVSQRAREIGIRIALGAEQGEVRRLFVRHAFVLTAVGVAVGVAAAAALTRAMSALLFEVSPMDPATYAAVGVLLMAAALLASYIPARRATGVDPARALRAE